MSKYCRQIDIQNQNNVCREIISQIIPQPIKAKQLGEFSPIDYEILYDDSIIFYLEIKVLTFDPHDYIVCGMQKAIHMTRKYRDNKTKTVYYVRTPHKDLYWIYDPAKIRKYPRVPFKRIDRPTGSPSINIPLKDFKEVDETFPKVLQDLMRTICQKSLS